MWAAFINRVRDHLHIVLAMSPVGESFRARCRQVSVCMCVCVFVRVCVRVLESLAPLHLDACLQDIYVPSTSEFGCVSTVYPSASLSSGIDCISTGLDCIFARLDCISTGFDCVSTGLDCISTGVDCKSTGLDCISTKVNCKSTGLDCISTGLLGASLL